MESFQRLATTTDKLNFMNKMGKMLENEKKNGMGYDSDL